MSEHLTPLSVAFIWHMHQPEYKDDLTGGYLMPWVRLHAIKDYLDMVLILEKYPKIRQTFNLVPVLIDQLEDYCQPDTRDRHLTLTLQDAYSDEEKTFILKRFFDAAPETMIARSPWYQSLYERRNQCLDQPEPDLCAFTDAEYADIVTLFNLVWFDPLWFEKYPELDALWTKGKGFTLDDRKRVVQIQREIIQQVLPTYKAFQEKGQIEVTTTPYYHPILPLLIDTDSARMAMPGVMLPDEPFRHPEDAEFHVRTAYERYKTVFGMEPPGVWPAEQSISPEAVRMLKKQGFQWAVSSEGNLARSLGVHFEKDPFGNIHNIDILCQPYQFEGMKLLFRHLTLSDLIGFHYSRLSADEAVSDLMNRLKHIQRRCTQAGLQYPVVTIALDGENCWEHFPNDGHEFLHKLYTALSSDSTLNVCRVRDYLEQVPDTAVRTLHSLHSGSWINSNFHIWIGDPVKNAAWMHLNRTRTDLEHLSKTGHYTPEVLKQAWKEIYIAQGSDWFWWYGEPHHSGQDDLFDMQFRRHLANVYRLMDLEIPDFLEIPLSVTMGRPVVNPTGPVTPLIDGKLSSLDGWDLAGSFDLTYGAMHQASRLLKKIYYGTDTDAAYMRFDLNPDVLTPHHEIFVYFITPGKTRHNSPIRIKGGTGQTVATQRYLYAYEIQLGNLVPGPVNVSAAEALPDHLWYHRSDIVRKAVYDEVLEVALDLNHLHIQRQEMLQFAVAVVHGGILEDFQPEKFVLSVKRYSPPSDIKPLQKPTAESDRFQEAW